MKVKHSLLIHWQLLFVWHCCFGAPLIGNAVIRIKMKEKPKKKQHWVPYFYLKNWATNESKNKKYPQGWILSINEGEPQKVNLRDFAAKRYLYSPPDKNGVRSFDTEDKLSDYEDIMSKFWPMISSEFYDFSEGTSIRKAIALFISLLYLRRPSNIDSFKHMHSKLIEHYEKFPKDKNGNPSVNKLILIGKEYLMETSDYKDYKNLSDIDFNHMFVESIHIDAVPIAEILLKKRWAILFSQNENFITSDNPVVVENIDRETFGLRTKGTIITFPISPSRILIMDDLHNEGDGKFYPLKDENSAISNFTIWRNVKKFMLSNRNPDLVCEEIVNYVDEYV